MAISAISGFSPAIQLIDSLSPLGRVSLLQQTSSLSSLFSLSSTQTSISDIGRLLNRVESLQSAATALSAPGIFVAQAVNSSDSDIATATASAATPAGSYTLQVDQLAQGQTLTTAAQASSLSPIGSGAATLTFAFAGGGSRSVTLGAADNTLAGIAAAINKADIGVEARLVTSGSGVQLALSGPTGAGNTFSIAVSGNAGLADVLAYAGGSGGPTLTSQARDAQGQINGIAFSASTNSVNTATPGLALNLSDTGTATLTVAANGDAAAAVRSFIDTFNDVQTGFAELAGSTPTFGLTASFFGSRLTATLNAAGGGTSNPFSALAGIGISVQFDGTLGFNEAIFQRALNDNPQGIAAIFSNGGNGVAEQVAAQAAGPLSAEQLLPVLTPALTFQGALAGSSESTLLMSLFGQSDFLGNAGLSSSQSNELLFAQLISASQAVSQQNGTSLIELMIGQSLLSA